MVMRPAMPATAGQNADSSEAAQVANASHLLLVQTVVTAAQEAAMRRSHIEVTGDDSRPYAAKVTG